MNFKVQPFGKADGREVQLYTLTNANGMRADITNYGGIVVRLYVPDKNGKLDDIVLGYDTLDGYLKETPYFGAIVGRYGNRIAGGRFTLDGREYTLARNNPPDTKVNHLHGGIKGFDKVVWDAELIVSKRTGNSMVRDRLPAQESSWSGDADEVGLTLHYLSRDGEEGYPGNLDTHVTYSLTNANELRIDYRATTDKPTPVNLTNHSYFNLGGFASGSRPDILYHWIMINADKFTPVNETLIPTGELRPVDGTPPFDLRVPGGVLIADHINDDEQQIKFGGGYDHNFVLNRRGPGLSLAAYVHEPHSDRVMKVFTTEPGIQFYSGNFLDGSITGKGGQVYKHRYGFCLETQHFPDSPNQPNFPSAILRPGEEYHTTTIYAFSTSKSR